jgi:hypothetical protein
VDFENMWAAVNGQSGSEEESVKAEPAEQEEEEQHKIWNGFEPIYTHLSFPVLFLFFSFFKFIFLPEKEKEKSIVLKGFGPIVDQSC